MKLGILVNTARHMDDVVGLTRAALALGGQVGVFVMDEGTRLLESESFASLAAMERVAVSVCEHSAQANGVDVARLPPRIACGSQLNNAMLAQTADRIIVL